MATLLGQQPPSSRPSHEFAPSSPPDRHMFHQQSEETPVGPPLQYRSSIEFRRTNGPGFADANSGPPLPHGPQMMPNGGSRHRGTLSLGAFEGGKSPPGTKNTSHVPCKFFRSGQCQAGPACPFSHSLDISNNDTPCKYFAKGNCKFGQKCALAHVLPDGRVVNRPNGALRGSMGMGPRIDPQLYQQSDPVLAQSLLAQQVNGIPPPFSQQFPPFSDIDPTLQQDNLTPRPFDQPHMKDEYLPDPDSKYGSPREDSRYTSFSPNSHLSVLDAPLPASFDSQGVSWARQHGHVAASLPSRFNLLESSPPGSLPQRTHIPLDSIRNLQAPAMVGRDSRQRREDLGSSPLGSGDEGFGQRLMHSRKAPRPKILSTSMPRVDLPIDDSDSEFHFSGGEEDYIPAGLHDQIFTRDEQQQRRHSKTEQDRRGVREMLINGIPTADSSKVGSPNNNINTGSPSRYGNLFARHQQDPPTTNTATSPSAFGHVGSPLRNSALHPSASPSSRPSLSGDLPPPSFPSLSSPPRQSSMSALSQQLSRTRLTSTSSNPSENSLNNNKSLHPTRNASTSSATNMNRGVSTSSAGGRNTDRIEEENDTVFSMEEDFEEQRRRSGGVANATTGAGAGLGAWGINPGKASPRLGPIGTGRSSGDFT